MEYSLTHEGTWQAHGLCPLTLVLLSRIRGQTVGGLQWQLRNRPGGQPWPAVESTHLASSPEATARRFGSPGFPMAGGVGTMYDLIQGAGKKHASSTYQGERFFELLYLKQKQVRHPGFKSWPRDRGPCLRKWGLERAPPPSLFSTTLSSTCLNHTSLPRNSLFTPL